VCLELGCYFYPPKLLVMRGTERVRKVTDARSEKESNQEQRGEPWGKKSEMVEHVRNRRETCPRHSQELKRKQQQGNQSRLRASGRYIISNSSAKVGVGKAGARGGARGM